MRDVLDRPNIILINCDDLGYGDLGCYGSPVNQTPVLDRMASEGVRFTDFYMAAPVCTPSRAAMMTGCYPPRVGLAVSGEGRGVLFPGDSVGLNPQEMTIARLLKSRDYATLLVGKWHLGDQPEFLPTRHGFDHYYGLPYSNDMGRQNGRHDKYPPLPLMDDEEVLQVQPDQASLTERYVERAVEFLRASRDRPFFLYFAHMYVHVPLFVPQCFLQASRNGAYGAAVASIDWATGVLLHELRQLGLDGNTIVLFTSDNGSRVRNEGGSNAPLRGTKATTWEGGLRVPCIVRWPGVFPAGACCRQLATAMDFLPTLAGLAGAATPDDRIIDGRDIRTLLADPEHAASPHEAFYYYHRLDLHAVRSGRWKLHLQSGELYDLEADIGETTSVAAEHPQEVRRLESLADRCRADLGDAARNVQGANCRPPGRVADPRPLATYDPDHPYITAMYDLEQAR